MVWPSDDLSQVTSRWNGEDVSRANCEGAGSTVPPRVRPPRVHPYPTKMDEGEDGCGERASHHSHRYQSMVLRYSADVSL